MDLTILHSVCDRLPTQEDKQKFWQESIHLSLNSLNENFKDLILASQTKDLKKLERSAHKLAGTVSFVGANDLATLLQDLQHRCSTSKVSWPVSEIPEITSKVEDLAKNLTEALKEPSP